MGDKIRLDVALQEKGLSESRERGKNLITMGLVFVDGQKITKSSFLVSDENEITIKGQGNKYVSRGGLKLENAMKKFPIDLNDTVCADIGASTGGFTDCMLQNGATKVYAIDVGYGQLAWSLRQDERVVNLERQNIRYVTEKEVPEKLDFISIDVSFISLTLVLPVAYELLKDEGSLVCLIKPQFEAGKDKVGKKGVVRESKTHEEVIKKIMDFAQDINFKLQGLTYSPIKGPEGNIEYLLYISKSGEDIIEDKDKIIKEIVEESHSNL